MNPDDPIIRRSFALLEATLGRSMLAALASWHARRATGRDIQVLYDRFWMHRIERTWWCDSPGFVYRRWIAAQWLRRADAQAALVRDCWFHLRTPEPGETIVDVGAGAGIDLPIFSRQVGPEGRVLAIEAHPTTFAMMQRSVERNALANVTCVHRAILDRSARVAITDGQNRDGNSVAMDGTEQPLDCVEVDASPLVAVCDEHGIDRIGLLKMNIEGAERHAITVPELLPRVRTLCVACHDFRADLGDGESFRTRRLVIEFLADHGFEVTTRDDDARAPVRDHVHARNRRYAAA